ncbi:MAG: hypothetical protein ACREP9_04925, partial [Candidatus Dormibacteraceae bacterium]
MRNELSVVWGDHFPLSNAIPRDNGLLCLNDYLCIRCFAVHAKFTLLSSSFLRREMHDRRREDSWNPAVTS